MKIEYSTVKKIVITDINNLDPISVYLEDFMIGKGKLTITCLNESWTYYWGAMGNNNLSQFIINCDNDYLCKKLNPSVPNNICDENGFESHAKRHIVEKRKVDDISKEKARMLYDQCCNLAEYKYMKSLSFEDYMYEIFGDEWYDCYPEKINPKYEYFYRILDVVKWALKNHTQSSDSQI